MYFILPMNVILHIFGPLYIYIDQHQLHSQSFIHSLYCLFSIILYFILFATVFFDWYVDKSRVNDSEYLTQCLAESERVQLEDMWLCERVQKGLQSQVFEKGTSNRLLY